MSFTNLLQKILFLSANLWKALSTKASFSCRELTLLTSFGVLSNSTWGTLFFNWMLTPSWKKVFLVCSIHPKQAHYGFHILFDYRLFFNVYSTTSSSRVCVTAAPYEPLHIGPNQGVICLYFEFWLFHQILIDFLINTERFHV